eukprot:COSAG01_NODE_135_length_24448_cov_154.590086_6_plen_51_part_00
MNEGNFSHSVECRAVAPGRLAGYDSDLASSISAPNCWDLLCRDPAVAVEA